VAVVCDGCSSGAHSEVGAQVGAQVLVQAIARELAACMNPGEVMDRARTRTLAQLTLLAEAMGGAGSEDFRNTVGEHLLFTVVGFVLGPERAWAFALGDGALVVNDSVQLLGPFPGNAPPYLGYALLGEPGAAAWNLELRPLPPPAEIQTLIIATDGAAGIDFVPFGADPRVLRNPDFARRLLWQQARERALDDDATLVVARRLEVRS